jgi:hypothetical protein
MSPLEMKPVMATLKQTPAKIAAKITLIFALIFMARW